MELRLSWIFLIFLATSFPGAEAVEKGAPTVINPDSSYAADVTSEKEELKFLPPASDPSEDEDLPQVVKTSKKPEATSIPLPKSAMPTPKTSDSSLAGRKSDPLSAAILDPSFSFGAGFDSHVLTFLPSADASGSLYVGGNFRSYRGTATPGIARLHSDGTPDLHFAVGQGFDGGVFFLLPSSDTSGKFYAGGSFSSYDGVETHRLARLNPDGSLDSSFRIGSGFDWHVRSLASDPVAPDKLYVAGDFASFQGRPLGHIARLNSDGSLDTSFRVGNGFDQDVYAIVPTNDGSGRIYVGGIFGSYNGIKVGRIARLKSDGSLDTAFDTGLGLDGNIFSMALDDSGKLYVAGPFHSLNGVETDYVVRINGDGSLDTGFRSGAHFDNYVEHICFPKDGLGKLYVSGSFHSYDGTPIGHIARLNRDGSLDTAFDIGLGYQDVGALATGKSGTLYMATSLEGADFRGIVRLKPKSN